MSEMYSKKLSFIAFELENLVKKIDNRIIKLAAVPNKAGDDVVAVAVCYGDNEECVSSVKVNVECDSLSAIAIDVIKKIQ